MLLRIRHLGICSRVFFLMCHINNMALFNKTNGYTIAARRADGGPESVIELLHQPLQVPLRNLQIANQLQNKFNQVRFLADPAVVVTVVNTPATDRCKMQRFTVIAVDTNRNGTGCGWTGYIGGLYMGRTRANKKWTTYETNKQP